VVGGGSPEDNCLYTLAQSITQWSLQQVQTGADGRADLPVFERPRLGMEFRVVGEPRAGPMPLAVAEPISTIIVK
jgi:hypothetical protein